MTVATCGSVGAGENHRSGSARDGFDARHCEERLRRSNPECRRGWILDCFATLAMTALRQLRKMLPQRRSGESRESFSRPGMTVKMRPYFSFTGTV
jgi:hypothetical protein